MSNYGIRNGFQNLTRACPDAFFESDSRASGGSQQLFSEELYGIPPEMVMGTSVQLEYAIEGDDAVIKRTDKGQYLNRHHH